MCKFKIGKITYPKPSVEQHITLRKVSLQCILESDTVEKPIERTFQKVHQSFGLPHPLTAPPKYRSWAPKWTEIGVYLVASCTSNTGDRS